MGTVLRNYVSDLSLVMGSEELPRAAIKYVEDILTYPIDKLLGSGVTEYFFVENLRTIEKDLAVFARQGDHDKIKHAFLDAITQARLTTSLSPR